jgi:hypothetical protein
LNSRYFISMCCVEVIYVYILTWIHKYCFFNFGWQVVDHFRKHFYGFALICSIYYVCSNKRPGRSWFKKYILCTDVLKSLRSFLSILSNIYIWNVCENMVFLEIVTIFLQLLWQFQEVMKKYKRASINRWSLYIYFKIIQ